MEGKCIQILFLIHLLLKMSSGASKMRLGRSITPPPPSSPLLYPVVEHSVKELGWITLNFDMVI
jgi:hypothetical protein